MSRGIADRQLSVAPQGSLVDVISAVSRPFFEPTLRAAHRRAEGKDMADPVREMGKRDQLRVAGGARRMGKAPALLRGNKVFLALRHSVAGVFVIGISGKRDQTLIILVGMNVGEMVLLPVLRILILFHQTGQHDLLFPVGYLGVVNKPVKHQFSHQAAEGIQ